MKKVSSDWNSSATKFNRYSVNYPMYKKMSNLLVKKGGIKKEMTVLDLACGTGTTTKEILKSINDKGKIVAIDSSKKMIEICKSKIRSKNVHFIRSPAEKLNSVVHIKFDVVICNAAFWQFKNKGKVLKDISSILKPKGILIFSIPYQFYKANRKYRVLVEILKTINELAKKYGYHLKKRKSKKLLFNYIEIKSLLIKYMFNVLEVSTIRIDRTPNDLFEFFNIPVMTPLPNVPQNDRAEILNEALLTIRNKYKSIPTFWVIFVARKHN